MVAATIWGCMGLKTVTKIVLALVVIAGAGAAGWWFFSAPKAATVPNTVTVGRADIEQTVLASGVLQANSLVSVGAEVSGRIDAVNVKLGQDVKKGDVIAEIDSLNQENAVKAAQAALTAIEAQKRAQEATLVQAKAALARNTSLSAGNLVSKTDLDSAQAAVDSSLAQIDQSARSSQRRPRSVRTAPRPIRPSITTACSTCPIPTTSCAFR